MKSGNDMTVAERLAELMDALGIEKAHFAGRSGDDWAGIALASPDRIMSLTLIGVGGFVPEAVQNVASRLQLITGADDQGEYLDQALAVKTIVPNVKEQRLPEYRMLGWSDVVTERPESLRDALKAFLASNDVASVEHVDAFESRSGEVAEISYQISGQGPPLFLFPLSFAPSQWNPLIPFLSENYCTIQLGGAHLGMMPPLEWRGQAPGFQRIIRHTLAEARLQPGHSVLEVGTGSGIVARWLARETAQQNLITAIDLNPYFVREATQLVARDGLTETITTRQGDGTDLPFPDDSFDLTLGCTVLEELDADIALTEMIRVTRPGGRIALVVRAIDQPFVFNLALQPELGARLAALHMPCSPNGCADVTLYTRMARLGLTEVKILPQLAVLDDEGTGATARDWLEGAFFFGAMDDEERTAWLTARQQAENEGSFFIAWPHHCAVGTKPLTNASG